MVNPDNPTSLIIRIVEELCWEQRPTGVEGLPAFLRQVADRLKATAANIENRMARGKPGRRPLEKYETIFLRHAVNELVDSGRFKTLTRKYDAELGMRTPKEIVLEFGLK